LKPLIKPEQVKLDVEDTELQDGSKGDGDDEYLES